MATPESMTTAPTKDVTKWQRAWEATKDAGKDDLGGKGDALSLNTNTGLGVVTFLGVSGLLMYGFRYAKNRVPLMREHPYAVALAILLVGAIVWAHKGKTGKHNPWGLVLMSVGAFGVLDAFSSETDTADPNVVSFDESGNPVFDWGKPANANAAWDYSRRVAA